MNWDIIQRETLARTSRSSGSGGQHVNKVETRVELVFYPERSAGLSEQEKSWLRHHLGTQYTQEGGLTVASQAERSQHRNRQRAWSKLEHLLRHALHPPRRKRQAKAFTANNRQRRVAKERQSEKKAWRRRVDW